VFAISKCEIFSSIPLDFPSESFWCTLEKIKGKYFRGLFVSLNSADLPEDNFWCPLVVIIVPD
jgi:hypothetical protein